MSSPSTRTRADSRASRSPRTPPASRSHGRVLSGTGNRAVVLLNRTSSAANITVRWSDLGLTSASATVRDLWRRSNLGSHATSYTASVPAGGSVMLKVSGGTEAASTNYTATSTGASTPASARRAPASTSSTSPHTNMGSTAVTGTLQVNSQTATTVSFPPTGSSQGTVSGQVDLSKGSANSLTFTGSSLPTPGSDQRPAHPRHERKPGRRHWVRPLRRHLQQHHHQRHPGRDLGLQRWPEPGLDVHRKELVVVRQGL
ncbi:hypothetical protein ACRAWF_33085 [Streptomyces sp. L7]